jgi:mono/diheme cytochrome c family protein
MARAIVAVLALAGLCGILGLTWLVRAGVGTQTEPDPLETRVARAVRHYAIPVAERLKENPVPAGPEALASGLAHFADHCASCHANDGSGDTEMGRALYPRAPDMRHPDTQALSDGELFFIIANGVKFTGMPAWGDGLEDDARQTWELVHFIRRLPNLTPADIERMESLNPRGPDEWREQEEIRRFLEGGDPPAPTDAPDASKRGPQ